MEVWIYSSYSSPGYLRIGRELGLQVACALLVEAGLLVAGLYVAEAGLHVAEDGLHVSEAGLQLVEAGLVLGGVWRKLAEDQLIRQILGGIV